MPRLIVSPAELLCSGIDWAKANNMKLDFNSTSFSHPKSGDQSLSNRDKGIRDFWIEHTIRSRKIADEMGKQLGDKACHNLWIHDGSKDMTVDRYLYRSLLKDSLDQIFAHKFANVKDAVESKVFGVPFCDAPDHFAGHSARPSFCDHSLCRHDLCRRQLAAEHV